jgi:signal transducing adaptor molecule
VPENADDIRLRQEEEELARVLELSKQDKGGRYQPSAVGGSSSSAYQSGGSVHTAQVAPPMASPQSYGVPSYQAQAQTQAPPPPQEVDINTATRVRALYSFATSEVGELPFERGDVIKVLDRGFKEWWRGACGGRIGVRASNVYLTLMKDFPDYLC